MRKDQPKLNKELKDLKSAVKFLKAVVAHRESCLDDQMRRLVDADEAILIAHIEYERLALNKPALTTHFAIFREVIAVK